MSSTLVSDFDECVACHVLHSLVSLVHELKQFVNDCAQELPVGSQESRVLAHYVHDIRGHDRLVVFASLLLTQTCKCVNIGPNTYTCFWTLEHLLYSKQFCSDFKLSIFLNCVINGTNQEDL